MAHLPFEDMGESVPLATGMDLAYPRFFLLQAPASKLAIAPKTCSDG